MAEANVSALNGLYREVYDELVKGVPEGAGILKIIKYDKGNKLGDSFHQPIVLTEEQGYAYGGTAGDAFALEDPVAMTIKDAVVSGYTYCMQSAISLAAASRALSAGRQAAAGAVSTVLANALESSSKRLAISVLYGQSGLGDVPDTAATVETTSTTATLVFSRATWAPGIWAGREGAKLHFYDLDNDALISSGADAVFSVTTVDNTNLTLVVTGTSTGIDALDVAVQAGGVRAYFKGSKTADMAGLKTVLANTGSIFGIDAGAYGVWRGNSFNVEGALTHQKLQDYVGQLVARGLMGDITVLVNPRTWSSLNSDEAALRVYDGSYSKDKAKNGFGSIEYYGQNGKISIISDFMVKEGDGFMFQPENLSRIGSAENDSNLPTQDKNPFFALASTAGFGFRHFSDQALYSNRPAYGAYLYGIVNS